MRKPVTNPDSERQIRRIDAGTKTKGYTRGFQVHFSREGRLWTKFFGDTKHQGKESARRAARKFRDSLEASLPSTQSRAPIRENANGYSLRTRKNRDGTVTQYISASVATEEGKSVRKAFRIVGDTANVVKAALDWRISIAARRLRNERRQAKKPHKSTASRRKKK